MTTLKVLLVCLFGSLGYLFCSPESNSTQVNSTQAGDFEPHEIGNTWVYEGIYSYYHPMDGNGTAKLIRTVTVKSSWRIADTEFVVIEVLDTGHTVRSPGADWGDPLATDSIFRSFSSTCVFCNGTLINSNSGNLFWEGVPFCKRSPIDKDSLLPLVNGDPGFYFVDQTYGNARYIKGVGLATYQFFCGMNHGCSYQLNLIGYNGHPYSRGEVIRFEQTDRGKAIKENDTIRLGFQELGADIYLGYVKYDKVGNGLEVQKVYWATTGSLSYEIPAFSQGSSLWYKTSDVTTFQEGYIIATPVDSGVVLSPDRVYVILNPSL